MKMLRELFCKCPSATLKGQWVWAALRTCFPTDLLAGIKIGNQFHFWSDDLCSSHVQACSFTLALNAPVTADFHKLKSSVVQPQNECTLH